jgi:hypothetical protein
MPLPPFRYRDRSVDDSRDRDLRRDGRRDLASSSRSRERRRQGRRRFKDDSPSPVSKSEQFRNLLSAIDKSRAQ